MHTNMHTIQPRQHLDLIIHDLGAQQGHRAARKRAQRAGPADVRGQLGLQDEVLVEGVEGGAVEDGDGLVDDAAHGAGGMGVEGREGDLGKGRAAGGRAGGVEGEVHVGDGGGEGASGVDLGGEADGEAGVGAGGDGDLIDLQLGGINN